MFTVLHKNPRLLLLIIAIIAVSGFVALAELPRMEDPRLTPRAARIVTVLPGADAERVESLVTEKLEEKIKEIEEVKEIRSTSSTNVSFVAIELDYDVDEVEAANVWSKVRDQMEDAKLEMPAETQEPNFNKFDITASAMIVALKWELKSKPNFAILTRLIKELKDQIDDIPGTEKTELFGEPNEEVLVTLDANSMTALGLNAANISREISFSDSKVTAGLLRTEKDNILLDVAGEFDTLDRIGQIPIRLGESSNTVNLEDIASIEKSIRTPMDSTIILNEQTAIAIGVQIQPTARIDLWAKELNQTLVDFEATLPHGVALDRMFDQNHYVSARMENLLRNLAYGAVSIFVVILIMMGWRSATIVGTALPIVSLLVLAFMYGLGIPIHQMSITGLIISLGLMIDNAIVVVDEIAQRIENGVNRLEAVEQSTRFLWKPLLGSTLTTALAFSPIFLMGGPTGEFVGSIALVAALSVIASLFLAITVIATLASIGLHDKNVGGWWAKGISLPVIDRLYESFVGLILRFPTTGILMGLLLPCVGFVFAIELPEQFFPPADRDQMYVELELAATSTIQETEKYAARLRAVLIEDPRIEDVKWFLGESALMFYYNVLPFRRNTPQYGQGIVDCVPGTDVKKLINEKQDLLATMLPQAIVILRQLEQGPPFEAPIEVRVSGPDNRTLREIGDELRLLMSETPHVHTTRASFSESLPKISFEVDEQKARLAGLYFTGIANELNSTLEGITGGTILEASEELPVRVRVSGEEQKDLNDIASLDLLIPASGRQQSRLDSSSYRGIPLSAISNMSLKAETVSIERLNGERLNEVQAYIDAGVLPSQVQNDFEQRLMTADFQIPSGYKLEWGGAKQERDEAVSALAGKVVIIIALMIATIVYSMSSFRLAGLLFFVAFLSVGIGFGALWLAGHPWGFMSLVAMMGMIGVTVNDSIVVLASIREPDVQTIESIRTSVVENTRHILSTTFTTIVGFTPLFLFGGDFWSPVAIAISGGVAGATVLALIFVPCVYVLLFRIRQDANTHMSAA